MPITRNGKGASLAPAVRPRLKNANGDCSSTTHNALFSNEDEALTTSGRTYEELVSASLHQQHAGRSMSRPRDSMMSDKTEESESPSQNGNIRQSVGVMLGQNLNIWSTGRNSLSNWSSIGGEECDDSQENMLSQIPSSVHMGVMDIGRKSNASISSSAGGRNSLEPHSVAANAMHINISHRNMNSRTTQRSNVGSARVSRPKSLNMSHISSSSSSGLLNASGEMLDDSWTPIRTSLEHSFNKTAAEASDEEMHGGHSCIKKSLGGLESGVSLSPIRGRLSTSPKRSPVKAKSPVRSPFGDVSPNRSPKRLPRKANSPKKGSMTLTEKKALSPNGTYSLKEAEGKCFSMPASTATTKSDNVSGGSSNMSVSSGSETMVTALFERHTSSMKSVLPSVSARRNSLNETENMITNNIMGSGTTPKATTTQEGEEIMTTLFPAKTSPKGNVRSPLPTPNRKREVIKRFRASVPSADYLDQDELADKEEMMAVVVKPAGASSEVADTMTQCSLYENSFVFPSSGFIPLPHVKTLRMFHDQAVSVGSPSHQYQLNRASSNAVSLQEVVLPAIAYEISAVLKHMQAKALRNVQEGMPDSLGNEVVEVIETCRKVVAKCTDEAMRVAGEAWREREAARERLRMERLLRDKEQQLSDKRERKEARSRSRQERTERQKCERQRNHPRNKEIWQEVLKITGDIQKLEKEERLWKEALVDVNQMVDNYQTPEVRRDLESLVKEKGTSKLLKSVDKANLESLATTLVGDVTMATERINWMLKSVSLAMEESDKLRKEAYDKYQYDGHKFVGYPKVDDPKGLFMALSMESP